MVEQLIDKKACIIILNYNGWQDTIECLESVLRNNYPNYQVIVIDNGSPNNSMEYIKAWAEGRQEVLTPEPGHPLYNLSHPPVKKPILYIYYTREEAEKGGDFELEERMTKEWQKQRNLKSSELIPTSPYPLIFIQTGENLGFAGGNNVGIKYGITKGDCNYFELLNNDTVVKPDFLDELVKVALQNEKIAIAGSIIIDYYTKKIVFTNSKIDRKLKAEVKTDYLNLEKDYWETERVCGASMMIKTEYILKHSLFLDEDLFMYCDEMDLCIRAKRQGLKIVIAGKSKVYHKENISEKLLNSSTIYYVIRNRILLARKLLNLKDRIIFWILFIPARLFRCAEWFLKKRFKLIKITFSAFRDGIKKKTGKR